MCGGDGGIASPQAPLTPSSKLFFLFPAFRLKDSVCAAAAPFPHKVPGLCGTPEFESPLIFFSTTQNAAPVGTAFCVAEMGGFELPKPWCGLRDFQSRALDQLGDISVH